MIVNGFLDWAIRIDGIADKVYSQPNSGEGIACHSIVGREDDFQDGLPNRFLSTEKLPNGQYTAMAAASCMFILRENGDLIQMHPITASTWTSGGSEGNTSFWAVEAEGGLYPNYGEQLTDAAAATFIRLVTEWENHTGLKAQPGINILQHRQIAAKYGYAATACASGRYDTAWSRISLGERYGAEVADPRIDKIIAALGGEEALDKWNATGNSLLAGYAIEQDEQNQVEAEVAKLKVSALPDHTHESGGVIRD